MKIDYELIGLRIKELRQQKEITQQQMAENAKITPGFISQIENGRKKVSLETLLSICLALNVTLNELLTGNQITLDSDYNKEYAELISDCDEYERRLLFEISKATQKALIKNRHFITKEDED